MPALDRRNAVAKAAFTDSTVKQLLRRHCEERSDEAIQSATAEAVWIASLRSQ